MSSSYTRCNSCKVTHFLHCRFLRDLTVKKNIIKGYNLTPFSLLLFNVFHLIKGHMPFSTTCFLNDSS